MYALKCCWCKGTRLLLRPYTELIETCRHIVCVCLALSCVLKAGFVKVGVLGVRPVIDLMFVALWVFCCCCFVCGVFVLGGA